MRTPAIATAAVDTLNELLDDDDIKALLEKQIAGHVADSGDDPLRMLNVVLLRLTNRQVLPVLNNGKLDQFTLSRETKKTTPPENPPAA